MHVGVAELGELQPFFDVQLAYACLAQFLAHRLVAVSLLVQKLGHVRRHILKSHTHRSSVGCGCIGDRICAHMKSNWPGGQAAARRGPLANHPAPPPSED